MYPWGNYAHKNKIVDFGGKYKHLSCDKSL